jgi:CheY-like chemotaxis protein
MEAALRSDGLDCEIVRVDTRDGFLTQLQSGRPDLIISDVSVPGFDGISAQRVFSCAERPDGRVRINVSDTGAGIRPEKLALLFTPFERLGADQTSIEGTGLGLALSRGLAEAMGGKVGVDSQVDVGSTFWIELSIASPAADRRPSSAASPTPPAVRPITGTVLYIEDNASNVRLLERLLKPRRPGITLMHASEGALGVDIALKHKPDLICLDVHLQDMPGEEILRQLWTNQSTRDIPVVVLSADATVSQSRRLIASGAAAYLTKPLDVSHLLTVLDERFS